MAEQIKIEKEYTKWCRKIAKATNENDLISHFRTHVLKHFNRHKNEGKLGRLIWLIGVYNFMNIFKEKFLIKTDDSLFQLCVHLKQHKKGPIPSFDVDRFMKNCKGTTKNYYYNKKRIKK